MGSDKSELQRTVIRQDAKKSRLTADFADGTDEEKKINDEFLILSVPIRDIRGQISFASLRSESTRRRGRLRGSEDIEGVSIRRADQDRWDFFAFFKSIFQPLQSRAFAVGVKCTNDGHSSGRGFDRVMMPDFPG